MCDPVADVWWHHRWPAKTDARRLLGSERLGGTLTDQPALELREAGEDVRQHLAGGCTRVHAKVQGDELPALPPRLLHEPREVEQRTGEPVELGDHERVGVASSEHREGLTDARPAQILGAVATIFDPLDHPATPLRLGRDSGSLCVEPGAVGRLLRGRDPQVAQHP